MAYSYRWQYCDMDFLRHCLKKYSLLLEKIPSAILTEETTGTQMFVTEFLSDCIKRCDDGFDDYTMTALLPEGAATVTLQENRDTVRRLSTRYHGEYAALLPEMAAYYFSKAGRQQRRDTEQALGKRCFAFFDYAYNRMLEAQFLRHDFRWVGGEIPSVNHLKTLSDAADLTEALGQFRREEYDRRKEHDFSHAKLCTFLETRFGMLYFENRFAAYLLQPVSGGFSALESKVRVRYRIDGALYERMVYDNSLLPAISTRIKILGGMDISEKRKPQDGRMSIMVDRQDYDIRISSLPTVHGEKIVMRISSKLNLTRNKKELGLPPDEMERFNHMLASPFGIILVTGPTGSGKSTTLASLIHVINQTQNKHIITLEDPIEYLHPHSKSIVLQREIGYDSKSYASALRAALREDPDVILVGEMRDLETISIAITAAETRHLVFSTLHTNSAAATIDRVIDVFPPHQQQQTRIQLSGVIEGIIAQQLLPKEGGGRVAAYEVMLATPAIRNLIREGKSFQIQSMIQTSKKLGMQAMDDAIYDLYMQNKISAEDAVSFAQEPAVMQQKVTLF